MKFREDRGPDISAPEPLVPRAQKVRSIRSRCWGNVLDIVYTLGDPEPNVLLHVSGHSLAIHAKCIPGYT